MTDDAKVIDIRHPDDVRYVCPSCGLTRTLPAEGARMFEAAGEQWKPKCAKCKVDLERTR